MKVFKTSACDMVFSHNYNCVYLLTALCNTVIIGSGNVVADYCIGRKQIDYGEKYFDFYIAAENLYKKLYNIC